jgi:hypothetical protein
VLRYNSTPNSTPQNPLSQYKAVPQGQQENFYTCYIRSLHTVSYRNFVADVRELQNVWELSGQFEGDIVLSEGQLKNGLIEVVKNGLIDTTFRWPNKTVSYCIDDVFSEYCRNKIQSGMRGVELNIHALQVPPRKRPD